MKLNKLSLAIAMILSVAAADAFARKICDDGNYPPCNTEGEVASNSLSVPLWVTGSATTITPPGGATCSSTSIFNSLKPPTGAPLSGYPLDPLGYYYVQGIHEWQAPCATWNTSDQGAQLNVTAAWGDNLAGDAKLKVNSPIRVEIVLTEDSDVTKEGYEVVKLEPSALDRESSYGTLATDNGEGIFSATPSSFVPLVYDNQAWLKVMGNDGTVVVDEAATAEVNATGKVVYGYNLRVPSAQMYTITYTLPNVNITSWDVGTCEMETHKCSLAINVGSGGGSGGKGNRPW